VDAQGRRLAYRSVGEGKPIVLCLRFRGDMDSWDPAFIDARAGHGPHHQNPQASARHIAAFVLAQD